MSEAVDLSDADVFLNKTGPAEGGGAEARRCGTTGWSQVAEAPEAETDSGFMAGGRKVVGGASYLLIRAAKTEAGVRKVHLCAEAARLVRE